MSGNLVLTCISILGKEGYFCDISTIVQHGIPQGVAFGTLVGVAEVKEKYCIDSRNDVLIKVKLVFFPKILWPCQILEEPTVEINTIL